MGFVPALCPYRSTICTHRRWSKLYSRPLWRWLGRFWRQHARAFRAGRQQQQLSKSQGRVICMLLYVQDTCRCSFCQL